MATALMVGAALALAVALFAALIGLDRDRAFYTTVLIVVASYYVLFAVMGGATRALIPELAAFAGFACLAVLGFRSSLWLVALGLVAHGLFDYLRGDLIANPGVPAWWPMFCGTYDVVAGACLGFILVRRKQASSPAARG